MEQRYRDLTAFAARHHGLFRAADAVARGVSEGRLHALVRSGWCARMVRGVYRVSGAPPTPEQAILAAVWQHPGLAAASHRSGGYLLTLPGICHTRPEVTVPHHTSRRVGRVDCLWREAKVVLELDGARYHGGATARDADRRRDNRLQASGWRVLRLTWDDICHHPAEVIRLVRSALGLPR